MFERFARDARDVVTSAQTEAGRAGARQVEAEHLLLALAARGVAGLDRQTIATALEDEQRRSLAAVGIALEDFAAPDPDVPAGGTATKLRFGTSAKSALELTLRAAIERGDKRITAAHVLLGLLRAQAGTVPRALAVAGLDPADLTAAADAERR